MPWPTCWGGRTARAMPGAVAMHVPCGHALEQRPARGPGARPWGPPGPKVHRHPRPTTARHRQRPASTVLYRWEPTGTKRNDSEPFGTNGNQTERNGTIRKGSVFPNSFSGLDLLFSGPQYPAFRGFRHAGPNVVAPRGTRHLALDIVWSLVIWALVIPLPAPSRSRLARIRRAGWLALRVRYALVKRRRRGAARARRRRGSPHLPDGNSFARANLFPSRWRKSPTPAGRER